MNKAPNNLGAFFIFNNMKIFFESVVDEIIDKINEVQKIYPNPCP